MTRNFKLIFMFYDFFSRFVAQKRLGIYMPNLSLTFKITRSNSVKKNSWNTTLTMKFVLTINICYVLSINICSWKFNLLFLYCSKKKYPAFKTSLLSSGVARDIITVSPLFFINIKGRVKIIRYKWAQKKEASFHYL